MFLFALDGSLTFPPPFGSAPLELDCPIELICPVCSKRGAVFS